MMKTIHSILVIFIFLTFASCIEDKSLEDNLPYFKFQSEDTPNLLNLPELNSRLTFVNQDNEELYFDVVKSESNIKRTFSVGNWVTSSTIKYFYFDELDLFLKSTITHPNNDPIKINIRRWPTELNTNVFPHILSKTSTFQTYISIKPFNNKNSTININYNEPKIELSTKQKSFYKVMKIDLTNNPTLSLISDLPGLDFLYFDINEGIIGFDDRNGKEWRLK